MSESVDGSAEIEQEQGQGISSVKSESPAPELPLRLSRELPSSRLSNIETSLSPLHRSNVDVIQPEPTNSLPQSSTSSLAKSKLQLNEGSSVSSSVTSPSITNSDSDQVVRDIIIRSFAPRVAVYASRDTDEFIKEKGFKDGLCGLIRPYGERLQGKVIIRDGIGGSRAWDDFGIRLVDSQRLRRSGPYQPTSGTLDDKPETNINGSDHTSSRDSVSQSRIQGTAIDQLLDHSLQVGTESTDNHHIGFFDHGRGEPPPSASLYHSYLRKVLSSASLLPFETFAHPVACVIAVSSHHPAPIEALRQLYASTGHDGNQSPPWVSSEFLRYYVLVHDEGKDDITKSTALFDLMKRHFGLHCHLLRLRDSQCVQTDDDSIKVPQCEWLSAEEEMEQIRMRDYTDDVETTANYIFESDATAIKAFLREMVIQSIVPFMENRVITWNDQVASRRRGISGRFMSLSKRWTGLGSSKNATSGSGAAANSSGSNYDHQRGFYPPQTPEATMRQLGDYAFMLRDFKLASSTYDFLRTDFSHDKAWAYHAAANEMAAITSLLIPPTSYTRTKLENVDQMLDNAAYSYITRSSMPMNVVRGFTLAMELLKMRGRMAVDDAARWGGRLLELGVLTPSTQALTAERLADCYVTRSVIGVPFLSIRKRQAAFWNVLAADSWTRLERSAQADSRLRLAKELYGMNEQPNATPPFASMQYLWGRLETLFRDQDSITLIDLGDEQDSRLGANFESEQLDSMVKSTPVELLQTSDIDAEGFTQQEAGGQKP